MKSLNTEIVVIGGGPSGLAAAETLQRSGFEVLILEKGRIAEHIFHFPTFMRFFSTPDLLELAGYPLILTAEKPSREEYLQYLRRFVADANLELLLGHRISSVEGESGDFRVTGVDRLEQPFEVKANRVVLATGAYAHPRMLNVPGEDLPKVSHYFTETHDYFGSKVLIVGGRNSAASTALELWRGGVDVTLCHRRPELGPLKYWISPDIENRIKEGQIPAYMPAQVKEIRPDSVVIEQDGKKFIELENDYVLALTGYQPDPGFLGSLGIEVNPENGKPAHNPKTLESNRPGLYMVGEMLSGRISGVIFIENSRTHGELIVAHLKQELAEGALR